MNGIEITPIDIKIALEESLKLQSHYAGLSNQYDGGERMTFDTVEDWIGKLIEIGTLPRIFIRTPIGSIDNVLKHLENERTTGPKPYIINPPNQAF